MFGRTEYRITPVAGEGEVWKEQVTIHEWKLPLTF
jgi:hypothetical protein